MSFAPDITETLARARADLRMGVPVILEGDGRAVLILAAETLDAQRLADVRAIGGAPVSMTAMSRGFYYHLMLPWRGLLGWQTPQMI